MDKNSYIPALNHAIHSLFFDLIRIALRRPRFLFLMLKLIIAHAFAARKRKQWSKKGITVPPMMIASITHRCNLRCKGCYSQAFHENDSGEISAGQLEKLLTEAHELGFSFILCAGGEPLMRPELPQLVHKFSDMIFPVFTNGTMLTDQTIAVFKRSKNAVLVLSIEGQQAQTDTRRGAGLFDHLQDVIKKLAAQRMFWGVSITVTADNVETISSRAFVQNLIARGCMLVFLVEYVPVAGATENLVPSDKQRQELLEAVAKFRKSIPAIFIAFPGDEEVLFDGCLSSGRGFVHVNANGGLEPCPFAPYSDATVVNSSLKEALKSKLLQTIRENHDQLKETRGGCALWEKREWVKGLIHA